jgi:single-stranded-DNA-specific exonuclease
LSALLDLVAIGTVADLVPLDRNNRVLVAAGLKRIRAGQACAGVRALLAAAGRDAETLSSLDLGYVLGPRINAAGRLDDMRVGIACLLTDEPERAAALAAQLDQMNSERRALQADMLDHAQALLASHATDPDATARVGVCVADPSWHAGVVGLVATKLKEQLHRPVVAFAPAQDGDALWRGSARSVPGFHIRDALADIATQHPGLIARFGGHAMAAGLTLAATDIARFAEAFDACARASLGDAVAEPVWWSDGELQGAEATFALAEALEQAAPWGQAFPEPLFDNVFRVEGSKVMAERHLRLNLRFAACGTAVDGVFFNAPSLQAPAQLRAVYQLAIDTWRGERRLRALLRHWEPA